MINQITIKHLSAIFFLHTKPEDKSECVSLNDIALVNAKFMQLGYVLSSEVVRTCETMSKSDFEQFYSEVFKVLNELTGNDVVHKPMYKGFPKEVLEANELTLFLNAFVHYLSAGHWQPQSQEILREHKIELTELQVLDVAYLDDIQKLAENIAYTKESVSTDALDALTYLTVSKYAIVDLGKIEYKEVLTSMVTLEFLLGNFDALEYLKTTSDVLRVIQYISGKSLDLNEPMGKVQFRRSERKAILAHLETVIKEDDVARHLNKWKSVFRFLHVGDYPKFKEVNRIASKIRKGESLNTFNSQVESYMRMVHPALVLGLLTQRPTEFARRLVELLNKFPNNQDLVISEFKHVVDKVSTRVRLQLMDVLTYIANGGTHMMVYPKGSIRKGSYLERKNTVAMGIALQLFRIIEDSLVLSYSTKAALGNVYIDSDLQTCNLPKAQRTASSGKMTLGANTAIPFGDKDYLRFFIHWIGMDVDLSSVFYNEKFEVLGHCSFTELVSEYGAVHSGDITRAPAPEGASEFIDIDIEKMLSKGVRYVSADVLQFSRTNFCDMEKAFVGFMTLDNPEANKIFQADQVKQKIDLAGESQYSQPFFFDLALRKMFWLDMYTKVDNRLPNNVESNKITASRMLKMTHDKCLKGYSLYDFFCVHVKARGGILVDTKEEADLVIGTELTDDISPYTINEINTNWI